MALQVLGVTRQFNLKKGTSTIKLADPNPEFSAEEVMSFLSNAHPELTTSTLSGPVISEDGTAVYEFKTTVGTKG